MGSKMLLEFGPSRNVTHSSREAAEQSRAVQAEPTSWEEGEHGGASAQDQDQEGEGGPGLRALRWRERREQDTAGRGAAAAPAALGQEGGQELPRAEGPERLLGGAGEEGGAWQEG
ncbi:hypothetical protein Nmel_013305 [Mimus melanotis]